VMANRVNSGAMVVSDIFSPGPKRVYQQKGLFCPI
jgi:hypothetical protein